MNQNLIIINQNYGAAIDEEGNITTISKNSEEYGFEEILRKENTKVKIKNLRNK